MVACVPHVVPNWASQEPCATWCGGGGCNLVRRGGGATLCGDLVRGCRLAPPAQKLKTMQKCGSVVHFRLPGLKTVVRPLISESKPCKSIVLSFTFASEAWKTLRCRSFRTWSHAKVLYSRSFPSSRLQKRCAVAHFRLQPIENRCTVVHFASEAWETTHCRSYRAPKHAKVLYCRSFSCLRLDHRNRAAYFGIWAKVKCPSHDLLGYKLKH